MSWSISLGRIAGSEIRIHLTFLIFLAWIGLAEYFSGGGAAALDAVLFILAVFACVVLHELGHAVAARRYGIATPDITLLPIGGLARLTRIPEKPGQEIVIAVAGPLVNVAIAAILILVFGARIDMAAFSSIEDPAPGFLSRLAAVNIFLVLFNLIPAFPMDGGRVLRAVLALRHDRRRATEVAARVGQAFAFILGFLGLMSGNAILVFIAVFVFLAAAGEAGQTSLMEIARRLTVDRAMVTAFEALGPGATIDQAADALIRTTQREFPVVDGGGRLRGFLTRDAMIRSLKTTGPTTPVVDAMARDPATVRSGQSLEIALKIMQEGGTPLVGVVDEGGRLLGYLSQENIGELMMLGDDGDRQPPHRRA
jgi:stage IV sporulation protein FB